MSNYLNRFDNIKLKWEKFKSNPDNKKTRIKNAADILEVSEAELLSTEIGENVFYLDIADYDQFFQKFIDIDKIMLLIRSDYVVHEVIVDASKTIFKKDSFIATSKMQTTITEFDSELFTFVFFEKKIHAGKELKSFQFFDINGKALIKIFLKGLKTDKFEEIAQEYHKEYQYEVQKQIYNQNQKNIIRSVNILEKEYNLKNQKITTNEINGSILRYILEGASKSIIPIKIHAFGDKITQNYRGIIKNIVDFGPWINVIDKYFNLHVLENNIKKSIINKYYKTKHSIIIISFFDSNQDKVIDIGPMDGYEDKFKNLVYEMEAINE
tara:strand:- start:348 stop:1322 length:975 start_codon:yes stop_codon:yes gene_type:complete